MSEKPSSQIEQSNSNTNADSNDAPVRIHVVALAQFERAIAAFNEMADRVTSGEFEAVADTKKTSGDLFKAVQHVMDERKRVNALGEKLDDEYSPDLDLDELRNELDGKLARLAGAAEEKDVSGVVDG